MRTEGWAGKPHECRCSGPDDSCQACSEIPVAPVELRRMTLADCLAVIPWRNACRDSLRTPTEDTLESQERFYWQYIHPAGSPHCYRSVYLDGQMAGMVGLCYLTRDTGEISLITDPDRRGQGIGGEAVRRMLAYGFEVLGLQMVWGEVYAHNPARSFWARLVQRWGGTSQEVTADRDGQLVPADRFQWTAEAWRERRAA